MCVDRPQTAPRIRRTEVLRYLGHTGQPLVDALAARIDEGIARCDAELDPRWTWRAFGLEEPDACGRRGVAGTALALEGASMRSYLAGASGVALMALTLGAPSERRLRLLGATDPLAQLIYDAAANDLVEWGADACEAEICAWAREQGLACGARFSPGYGDLGLDLQPRLLEVLQAGKRLGLAASADCLLVPTKSVTALVALRPAGRADAPADSERRDIGACGCTACGLRASCSLRARGLTCRRAK